MPPKRRQRGGARERPAQYNTEYVMAHGGHMNGALHHHPMLGYGHWRQSGGNAWDWIKGAAGKVYNAGKSVYNAGKKAYEYAKDSKIISKGLALIPDPRAQAAAAVAAQHGFGSQQGGNFADSLTKGLKKYNNKIWGGGALTGHSASGLRLGRVHVRS